ncbi:cytoskeleton protein RodZ [Paraburkholderia bannensis]|uniref:Cytoskeleton protein RodZ n=1 Tax=Paraburkholderia bannensis TaxID=765414 RepID=A0A7W9WPU1_9BURK|nr:MULTISPECIES: helix-turn-helix domain-containing protein [Paraburkholderia]MBB3256476.1 cytoskeleton protein RodZ [Paraburkholderia sp. WP4_3_2]MBB6101475.1 cytoskeleton protein RodZ [Paraburkholderia bannensis]
MSEPQHPFGTDGTETNAGRSAHESAPSPVQAVPETLGAVGARLAQLRQAKGWSVEDVSARLKVAVPKLRELEAGDISHLPDATFATGVVRAYAKLLGADPAPFTQALRRERGETQQDLSMPASAGADLPRGRVSLSLGGGGGARAPRRRASWLWGVALVVIAVIAIGMWHTNSGDSSAWFARIKSIANGVGSSTASSGPGDAGASSATVTEGQTAGATASASDAQAEEQATAQAAAATDQAGVEGAASATQAPQASAQAVTALTAAPAVAASAAPRVASAVAAPAPAASTPVVVAQGASAPVAAAGDTSTFAIRVTQDTWVNVRQKDGKEVFSGLIHGSDAREITGVGPLKVTVGNKAGIESMTLDGQPVDAAKYASARGNVARFVLP